MGDSLSASETLPVVSIAMPGASSLTLDTRQVNSATQYDQLYNLVRFLISVDSNGGFIGDLAESWEIDRHIYFTFTLKRGLKFSDGSEIQAVDIVKTFDYAKKSPGQIHFNFDDITAVEALGAKKVRISLRRPTPDFLKRLVNPEFGILHKSDYLSSGRRSGPTFHVSSGPYFIKSGKSSSVFKLNKFFELAEPLSPQEIHWVDVEKIDFDSPHPLPDLVFISPRPDSSFPKSRLQSTHDFFRPQQAFTYWISFGPTLSKSHRHQLAEVLTPTEKDLGKFSPALERADQIYLPFGPGRLSDPELAKIQAKKKKAYKQGPLPKFIRILIDKNYFLKAHLAQAVTALDIQAEIVEYKDIDQFSKLSKNLNKFHLVQINNDFSSLLLRDPLNVTFNPKRPLMHCYKDPAISKLLATMNRAPTPQRVHSAIKEIGRRLLLEDHAAPLFYFFPVIYFNRSLSLDSWSRVVPLYKLWQIKKRRN